ncbi:transcriptional regulator [Pelotomaculum thermopropionicum SI]|uniref:siroheme decarboxylase n=1 Tax=Pelotomaculum thermopropionicum (strain DSM 13744 / JCM 10971 / SI) TaxID=370438 RepID=A5D3M1_PELTS|nr:transcriptional regulator [Pelotomaculum thermopropionicum SI]
MLTEQDKRVIRVLQRGLPLESRPFKAMAEELNMTEEELIDKIKQFIKNGQIRRFGATVRHQDVGYVANAMIVWDVPDDRVKEAGRIMAGFGEVTHCYQRPRLPGWPYNIFTMVHGKTREECIRAAEMISQATGVGSYRLLFSTAELKKSSMLYFEQAT